MQRQRLAQRSVVAFDRQLTGRHHDVHGSLAKELRIECHLASRGGIDNQADKILAELTIESQTGKILRTQCITLDSYNGSK